MIGIQDEDLEEERDSELQTSFVHVHIEDLDDEETLEKIKKPSTLVQIPEELDND